MVKSHLQYCILTWCNGNKTLLQTLQRAANKFIRLIFKLNYRESVKNTMQRNHILTINQLFENELACFMHRYDHGKLPLACQVLLKNNSKSSKTKLRQTRSNSKYFPAYCQINLTMESIKYKCPVLWNKIPEVESRTQGSRPRPRTQKKSEAKDSLSEDRTSRGQGQECSRPRTQAQAFSQKKKVFKNFFQAISNLLAYPEFLIGGGLNDKSHEMTLSNFFQRGSFCATKIS